MQASHHTEWTKSDPEDNRHWTKLFFCLTNWSSRRIIIVKHLFSYFIHISLHIILGHGESFDSFSSLLCCSLCYAEMMSIKEYYLDDDESATVHFDNSTTSDWRGDDRLQRPDIRENEHLKSCRLGSSAITRVEKLILRETGKTERDWFSRELPLINDTQDSGSSLRMRSVHVQRKSAESLFETDWEANDKVK